MGVQEGKEKLIPNKPCNLPSSACRLLSGRSGLLLIYQSDVTLRTQLETTMAKLTELQLNTLCQVGAAALTSIAIRLHCCVIVSVHHMCWLCDTAARA